MILAFETPYRPLTSRPFLSNSTYAEYLPGEALRPYVSCFWASGVSGGEADVLEAAATEADVPEAEVPGAAVPGAAGRETALLAGTVRVIPDTCMDIIIEINHTRQSISSRLCGIQDCTFMVEQGRGGDWVTKIAARFYFWSARLFLDLELGETANRVLDLELVQPGCNREFEPLFYHRSVEESISWLEGYLLERLETDRYNPNLYNSIDFLLRTGGNAVVKDICANSCVSQRQMERLFRQNIGLPIKRVASLVRYQNVWGEVVRRDRFEIMDAVHRYGYADQAHLLNDFKRFHGIWPEQARQAALAWR